MGREKRVASLPVFPLPIVPGALSFFRLPSLLTTQKGVEESGIVVF